MRRGCREPISWMKRLKQRRSGTCLTFPLPSHHPRVSLSIPVPCSLPSRSTFASLSVARSLGVSLPPLECKLRDSRGCLLACCILGALNNAWRIIGVQRAFADQGTRTEAMPAAGAGVLAHQMLSSLQGSVLKSPMGSPGAPSQPEVRCVGVCLGPLPTPPWHCILEGQTRVLGCPLSFIYQFLPSSTHSVPQLSNKRYLNTSSVPSTGLGRHTSNQGYVPAPCIRGGTDQRARKTDE